MRELQTRMALNMILEKHRTAAVERHVREQFEQDLRGLTDAEQDSKELKSAKQHLLYERIIETVALPFPVGPATVDGDEPAVKDSLTKGYVKRRRRPCPVSSARRSRSRSGVRTGAARSRSARSRATRR
jgi:hypothetical protein